MKYLADVLTLLRLVAAVGLIFLTKWGFAPEWALWTFVAGELTDAFDGICARKWPFPPGSEPGYRDHAEVYDEVIDMALGVAVLIYVGLIVDLSGLVMLAAALVIGVVTELIAWGKLFGGPNRHTDDCLYARDPKKSDALVLARRKVYLVGIGTTIVMLLFATSYGFFWKIVLLGVAVAVGVSLVVIKKNRLEKVKP